MKARIGERQPQGILPGDPTAHGVRRLTIGQAVRTRHDGDERQAPRRFGRLPTMRLEGAKGRIIIDRSESIPHLHTSRGTWEGGLGHTTGFLGHRVERRGSKGHDVRPSSSEDINGRRVTRTDHVYPL